MFTNKRCLHLAFLILANITCIWLVLCSLVTKKMFHKSTTRKPQVIFTSRKPVNHSNVTFRPSPWALVNFSTVHKYLHFTYTFVCRAIVKVLCDPSCRKTCFDSVLLLAMNNLVAMQLSMRPMNKTCNLTRINFWQCHWRCYDSWWWLVGLIGKHARMLQLQSTFLSLLYPSECIPISQTHERGVPFSVRKTIKWFKVVKLNCFYIGLYCHCDE